MGSSPLVMESPYQGAAGRVGTRVGDYQLLDVIRDGGTEVVYHGRHVVTGVRVTIRILHDHGAGNMDLAEPLVGGARAARAVRHANFVAVIDVGSTPDGTVFVVTEYLEGETLEARLKRVARLPLFEAINILRQMAHGLGAVHEAGLVHGGLNPSKIFLCTRKGRRRIVRHSGEMAMHLAVEPEDCFDLVKLLDLGLAGLGDCAAKPAAPPYGSPEQAEGKPAERSSDIYSLGAVFYEMITGTAPFPCESPADILGKHFAGVVTMASRRAPGAGIDGQVDDIILKCLKKKPRLRYATTTELCEALDACVTDCAFLRDAHPKRLIRTVGIVPPEVLPDARQAGAPTVTKPAAVSMTTRPSRAQGVAKSSPPPIPRKHPVVRGRGQPPPIPRAWKTTPAKRRSASEAEKAAVQAPAPVKASMRGPFVPLPKLTRASAVARGAPPPIPLTSDLLTELSDHV